MAYALNTNHALYGNLVELFGVKNGELVAHKTARTFTKHADATFGTGTYGEHFSALAGGYTAKGASFSPYLTLNTSTKPNYTVVAVVNSSGVVQGGTNSSFLSRTAGGDTIRSGGKDSSGNAYGYRLTGAAMGTGGRMITYCRIGETSAKLYNNTTLNASSTSLGADYNSPDARADYLCGWDGQYSMTASLVWLAVFDKELTELEITDLYNSLGANNTFGLVEASTGGNGTSTGTLDSIDIISPTASGNGTGSGSTNGGASGSISFISLSSLSATATGTTVGNGTITTPVLKNNTGTVLANIGGWSVNVYDVSSGELVVQKTGLSTNASGILTIVDVSIVPGNNYTYEPVHATYGRRLPIGTAT